MSTQVYAWDVFMNLLPEVCQLPPMNFNGLAHMCIVGAPQQMIPHFEMYQDVSKLDNLKRNKNLYNNMKRLMKIVKRDYKRYIGWEK